MLNQEINCTISLAVVFVTMVLATQSSFAEEAPHSWAPQDFKLNVKFASEPIVQLPIAMDIMITYSGTQPVSIIGADLPLSSLKIDAPGEWVWSPPSPPKELHEMARKLKPGGTIALRTYLNEFFEQIKSGQGTLRFTLPIGVGSLRDATVIHLVTDVQFNISDDPGAGRKYIGAAFERFKSSVDNDERIEILRSFFVLDDPEIMPILLEGLGDQTLSSVHGQVRVKVCEFVAKRHGHEAVVAWLADHGCRWDYPIVEALSETGPLSPSEINRMSRASDIWIRLYLVRYFPEFRTNRLPLDGFDNELRDLRMYLDELKKMKREQEASQRSK